MSSVNKAIIVGRVGQDPDVRTTNGGKTIVNMSVATSERRNGEETTEWHRVTVIGSAAEFAAKYLKKGDLVYLEGKIQTRKWTDKAGIERYTTEVACFIVQSLSSQGSTGNNRSGTRQRPQSQQMGSDFDDDQIPFANPYRGRYCYVV